MSDRSFNSTVESLFKGMNDFLASKTVVGDPITVGDTILIPLVEVSFGMAAGALGEDKKQKGNGGMGGKMTPTAMLVLRNGQARLVNVKNQDTATKILDMVPDLVDRFTSGRKSGLDEEVDEAIKDAVDQMKEDEYEEL